MLWKIDKSITWDESPAVVVNTSASGVNGGQSSANGNGSSVQSTNEADSRRASKTFTFPKKGGSGMAATNSPAGTPTSVEMIIDMKNQTPANNTLKPPPSYTYTMASGSSAAMSKMKNQLIARRKAAKMLISVAVLFAICYLPIHILNITR